MNILHVEENKVVIVEFGATWCKNCKRVAPFAHDAFNKLSSTTKPAVFVDVDIDEADDIAAEYDISSIPRFKVFVNSNCVDDYTGSSENEIEELIRKHLA
jgi:thioredoxin 1